MDNDGNTTTRSVTISAGITGARLVSPSYAGGFQVLVNGTADFNYMVQASGDLITWVPLQTNRAPFTFVDTATGGSAARFYRAVSTP